MNEEEKKAVEELKNCCLFWEGQYISSDKEEDRKIAEKEISINRTLLNLLEKKDRQLEERTNRIRNLEKECQKYFDNMMEVIQENSKKDKIIDEMAKYIVDLIKYNNPEEIRESEEIKNYFEKKIEEGNNDRNTENM